MSLPTRAFAVHSLQTAALQCLIQSSANFPSLYRYFSPSTSYRILMYHWIKMCHSLIHATYLVAAANTKAEIYSLSNCDRMRNLHCSSKRASYVKFTAEQRKTSSRTRHGIGIVQRSHVTRAYLRYAKFAKFISRNALWGRFAKTLRRKNLALYGIWYLDTLKNWQGWK